MEVGEVGEGEEVGGHYYYYFVLVIVGVCVEYV